MLMLQLKKLWSWWISSNDKKYRHNKEHFIITPKNNTNTDVSSVNRDRNYGVKSFRYW